MSENDIKKILKSVENKELQAVGIYIQKDNYRIAEVEFEIDWDEHQRMIGAFGTQFNTDLPGWDRGTAPEAYIAVQRLVEAAKKMGEPVRSWIKVSPFVRRNPEKHKAVCRTLGYAYGSKAPCWKGEINVQSRNINYLPEAKVIQRVIR